MTPNYQEVFARIVQRLSNDNRGILQHTDFHDAVASINVALKEDPEPPHYTEVQEELERLGMSEGNARDLMLVYRALKVSVVGPP
jgi:hypothetical protein